MNGSETGARPREKAAILRARLRRPIWWLPKEKTSIEQDVTIRRYHQPYYAIWRYAKWRITWLSQKIFLFSVRLLTT